MGAKGTPGTMNKEYQEATNEYLKVCTHILFLGILVLGSWFLVLGLGVLDGRGGVRRGGFGGWAKGGRKGKERGRNGYGLTG
jgi:hypothetical protein